MITRAIAGRFPAILIGGPPHAGKSVLAYSLKQALNEARIQHYLLRTAPDGEGDWSQEAQPTLAASLRRKGAYTHEWVARQSQDISGRLLPLLVDVGGRPTPWQATLFDHCTHAILLTKDAESRAFWHQQVEQFNLLLIADITSTRMGPSYLEAETPVIRGTLAGLERGSVAAGPVFEAVARRVTALCHYSEAELFAIHAAHAPAELAVNLRELCRTRHPDQPEARWGPADLPGLLADVPSGEPLAVYGAGPAWLYAALACHLVPQPLYQFDPRHGWITPVQVAERPAASATVHITRSDTDDTRLLHLDIPADYLPYQPTLPLDLPPPDAHGIILSGRLPLWLYTALARFYRGAAWVAVYVPQLNRAVVVHTRNGTPGLCLDVDAHAAVLHRR